MDSLPLKKVRLTYDVGAESMIFSKREFILRYVNGKKPYLWVIGKVISLEDLDRSSLFVDKNPQSYAYCPLSYGESY